MEHITHQFFFLIFLLELIVTINNASKKDMTNCKKSIWKILLDGTFNIFVLSVSTRFPQTKLLTRTNDSYERHYNTKLIQSFYHSDTLKKNVNHCRLNAGR